MIELNKFYNMDCMEGMKEIPDKYFDLAIVDPPYALERFKRGNSRLWKCDNDGNDNGLKWDVVPKDEYFNELERVSKNQIIWGANNFQLPKTEYFVIWDKAQTVDNFASAEYAWTNCKIPAKIFHYAIHKVMSDRKQGGGKIHPTQKPVALYEWLLNNYAKAGDKILDTHVGSASSLIACYNLGFEYVGFELDKDYYDMACKRLETRKNQMDMFHMDGDK